MNRTSSGGAKSFDGCIAGYLKRAHQLVIGERTAEEIRMRLGSAVSLAPELSMEVKGRNIETGVPTTVAVGSAEIRAAIQEPLSAILESLKTFLEHCPPGLAANLEEYGILIVGTGASLRGLDRLLSERTGLPVHFADELPDGLCKVQSTTQLPKR